MDRSAHSGHDETLIARLYGGDVDELERARAIDLLADCPDCAALFADFGAIAAAAAAMPVPPRPRDFALTEQDAARLGRSRASRWPIFGLGLRRSLGGSLAALGLIGVVVTGAVSAFGTASSAPGTFAGAQDGRAALAAASSSSSEGGPVSVPTAAPAATAGPAELPATSPASVQAGGANDGGSLAAGSSGTVPAPTNQLGLASSGTEYAIGGGTTPGTKSLPSGEVSQGSGVDARLVWLVGFGALFAIGVAITILPRRNRRRGRGAGS